MSLIEETPMAEARNFELYRYLKDNNAAGLYQEIQKGNAKLIQDIIDCKEQDLLLKKDSYGCTPLVLVASTQQFDLVEKLIESKANLEVEDNTNDRDTALSWAYCYYRKAGAVEFNSPRIKIILALLHAGANIDHKCVAYEINKYPTDTIIAPLIELIRKERQNPSNKAEILIQIAQIYTKLGYYNYALESYQRAAELNHPEALFVVGSAHVTRGQYDQAVTVLTKCFNQKTSDVLPLFEKIESEIKEPQIKLNMMLLAMGHYQHTESTQNLNQVCLRLKKLIKDNQVNTQALEQNFLKCLTETTDDKVIHASKILIYQKKLSECKENNNEKAKLEYELGIQYVALNYIDKAFSYFQNAVQLGHSDAVIEYANMLLKYKNDYANAIAFLEAGVDRAVQSGLPCQAIIKKLEEIATISTKETKEQDSASQDSQFNAYISLARIHVKLACQVKNPEDFLNASVSILHYYQLAHKIAQTKKLKIDNSQIKFFDALDQFKEHSVASLSDLNTDRVKLLLEASQLDSKDAKDFCALLSKQIVMLLTGNVLPETSHFTQGFSALYGLNGQIINVQNAIVSLEKAVEECKEDAARAMVQSQLAIAFCKLAHSCKESEDIQVCLSKALEAFKSSINQKNETLIIAINHQINLLKLASHNNDKIKLIKCLCDYLMKYSGNHIENPKKSFDMLKQLIISYADPSMTQIVVEYMNKLIRSTQQIQRLTLEKELAVLCDEKGIPEITRYKMELYLCEYHEEREQFVDAATHYEKAIGLIQAQQVNIPKKPQIYSRLADQKKDDPNKAMEYYKKALDQAIESKDFTQILRNISELTALVTRFQPVKAQIISYRQAIDSIFVNLNNEAFIKSNFDVCCKLSELADQANQLVIKKGYPLYQKDYHFFKKYKEIDALYKTNKKNFIPSLLNQYAEYFDKKDEQICKFISDRLSHFILNDLTSINADLPLKHTHAKSLFFQILNSTEQHYKSKITIKGLYKLANIYHYYLCTTNKDVAKLGSERLELLKRQVDVHYQLAIEISKLTGSELQNEMPNLTKIKRNLNSIMNEPFAPIKQYAQQVLLKMNYMTQNLQNKPFNKAIVKAAARENHLSAILELARKNAKERNFLFMKKVSRPLYLYLKAYVLASVQPESKETKDIQQEALKFIEKTHSLLAGWASCFIRDSVAKYYNINEDLDAFFLKDLKKYCKMYGKDYDDYENTLTRAMGKLIGSDGKASKNTWIQSKKDLAKDIIPSTVEYKMTTPSAPDYEAEPGAEGYVPLEFSESTTSTQEESFATSVYNQQTPAEVKVLPQVQWPVKSMEANTTSDVPQEGIVNVNKIESTIVSVYPRLDTMSATSSSTTQIMFQLPSQLNSQASTTEAKTATSVHSTPTESKNSQSTVSPVSVQVDLTNAEVKPFAAATTSQVASSTSKGLFKPIVEPLEDDVEEVAQEVAPKKINLTPAKKTTKKVVELA